MNTKIFCDIADLNLIKKFNTKNLVKGFTTNPSLMRNAGAKNYELYSKKILSICKHKPVSLEVFADDNKSMIDQGEPSQKDILDMIKKEAGENVDEKPST